MRYHAISDYGGDVDGQVSVEAASNALRPGVTRFGVTAGQYRNPSLGSHPLMFQGTLQHGLSRAAARYRTAC